MPVTVQRTRPVGAVLAELGADDAAVRAAAHAELALRADELPADTAALLGLTPTSSGQGSEADCHLDGLAEHYAPGPRWQNARYLWMKTVPPSNRGKVGEQLFARLVADAGAEVAGGGGRGAYDRLVDGVRVEVKLSTLYDLRQQPADEPSYYQWLQLRPGAAFDVVAFLAVDPDRVRVWVTDHHTALTHARGHHGGADATDTAKLAVNEDAIPAWFGPELSGDPAALRARVAALA